MAPGDTGGGARRRRPLEQRSAGERALHLEPARPSDPGCAFSGEYRPGPTDVPGRERPPPCPRGSRREPLPRRPRLPPREGLTCAERPGAGEKPGRPRGESGRGLAPGNRPLRSSPAGAARAPGFRDWKWLSSSLLALTVQAAGESSARLCGPQGESSPRLCRPAELANPNPEEGVRASLGCPNPRRVCGPH